MKNLKLLLLGLITPLLCGSVFAFDLTADEITYLNNNSIYQGSFSNVDKYALYDHGSNYGGGICVVFSGMSFNQSPHWAAIVSTNNMSIESYYGNVNDFTTPYFLFCTYLESSILGLFRSTANSTIGLKYSVDHYRVVSPDKIINGYLGFDVQGLLDDLSQCDTSVQQCLIDKESLSGSLASCNADKISLNNNIDSLTLQLQNCLGQSCEGSGDYGSGVYFNQYSLYRTDDEIDYSTPITNNLFLPLGYKGKINEDNILSIAKINTLETAYQFNDEDKITIIDILSICMLFLLTTGSIIGIIVFLKRLILKKS